MALVSLAAISSPNSGRSTSASPQPAEMSAWASGSCALCHTVPGQPNVPRTEGCSSCHAWIREVANDPERRQHALEMFPLWEQYEANVHSYLAVPDLDAAMARLEPSWVEAYLRDPYDTRPGMPESMPRFALTSAQIDSIVAAFAARRSEPPAFPAPTVDNLEHGERIFRTRGCTSCHAYGGNHPEARLASAPDLAHTRDRMHPDMMVAWIANPRDISAGATMPNLGLTEAEAIAVRDYLWLADPSWMAAAQVPEEPEPTKRPVSWKEVQQRVFGQICVHCHMDPALNEGRGGPGHDGGFGHDPTGVVLETREGAVDALPKLRGVLLARRHEAARDAVSAGIEPQALTRPAVSGMPMGHPPISDEDLSLVLGWIDQGGPP